MIERYVWKAVVRGLGEAPRWPEILGGLSAQPDRTLVGFVALDGVAIHGTVTDVPSMSAARLAELDRAVDAALREIKGFGYVPSYFIRMRQEMGTLGAFRALIAKPEVSEGFTRLALMGRLDLSVEAITLKFPELFSETELAKCRERLRTEEGESGMRWRSDEGT